ncbi:glycosyltransferase family 4 protein [Sphingomonas azotifigens]|uniref:glycosyltransferase family 4 protein n=1 Tax=Sphingomonas azotifigens TaxID=330920 RepID=UPI000A021CE5|nr:glycosyltransferase family 4 protein [Sphingomonas azotifigens]
MAPKRILFIIRSYVPDQVGGGAKSVQALAEGLAARGHDVHVLRLCPPGEEATTLAAAAGAGITGAGKPMLHVLPIRNIYGPYDNGHHTRAAKAVWHLIDLYNPWAARDLRRLLAMLRPDVVNTSIIDGFSTTILREAKRSGARLIHTMRDYYLICSRSGMYRAGKNCETLCASCKVVRSINRRQVQHVDLFLSNSSFVAETHRNHGVFGREKPCAVQWNVNDQPLAPTHRTLDEAAPIRFGYIGRLAPTKGVETLIEAARALPQDGRAWSLAIAGDGAPDYVAQLRALANGHPCIHFVGWQAAPKFYGMVDLVICPSVYNEPLPRVIYEAYGVAVPVVASRVGGNPEVVTPGVCGELYDGDSASDLAEKIGLFRQISSEGYARYSAGALAMGATFAPDKVVDSYESHLQSLFHDDLS